MNNAEKKVAGKPMNRDTIKAQLMLPLMYFLGIISSTDAEKYNGLIMAMFTAVAEAIKYIDQTVDGMKLHKHLNDVWLANTPTDTDDPETVKRKDNVCHGIQFAMMAIEEALQKEDHDGGKV